MIAGAGVLRQVIDFDVVVGFKADIITVLVASALALCEVQSECHFL